MDSNHELSPNMWQSTIWTYDGIIYWSIYVSLGMAELISMHILSICTGYKDLLIKVWSWKEKILSIVWQDTIDPLTHICLSKLTTIGSDNGLLPGWCQATNLSEIIIENYKFSFKRMHLKMPSGKWWSFCLVINVLMCRLFIWQNIDPTLSKDLKCFKWECF